MNGYILVAAELALSPICFGHLFEVMLTTVKQR